MVLTAGYQSSGPHHSSAGYGYSLTEGSNLSCPCKYCPSPYFYKYLSHYHIFHDISFHWDLSLVTAGEILSNSSPALCQGLPQLPLPASQVAVIKNPPANAGETRDADSIPGLGRSPGVGNCNLLFCSCLENPMDRGALWAVVHGVTKSQTWLSTLAHAHAHTSTSQPGVLTFQMPCELVLFFTLWS